MAADLMAGRIQLLSLAAADARSPVLYDVRITSAAGPHDMDMKNQCPPPGF